MAAKGRPPEYNDPRVLKKAVDEYFTACELNGSFPDFAGMKVALRLYDSDIDAFTAEDNPDREEYIKVLENARDRRESWLSRRMVEEPKAANGCMNALKQEKNGGYMDKSKDKEAPTVKIEFSSIPGGMRAFE